MFHSHCHAGKTFIMSASLLPGYYQVGFADGGSSLQYSPFFISMVLILHGFTYISGKQGLIQCFVLHDRILPRLLQYAPHKITGGA